MHPQTKTMEARLRLDLLALFSAFGEAYALSATAISETVFGDRQLHQRINKSAGSFRVRTYDMIVGRFSTLWPDDVKWPQGIPRVDEADLTERVRFQPVATLPTPRTDLLTKQSFARRDALLSKLSTDPVAA